MKKKKIRNFIAYSTLVAFLGTGAYLQLCHKKSTVYTDEVATFCESFDDDDFLIAAHRGFSGKDIENSLGAIIWANNSPFVDFIEIDVRLSDDGVLFVAHDNSVKTDNGKSFLISEHSTEEIQNTDYIYRPSNLLAIFKSLGSCSDGEIIRTKFFDSYDKAYKIPTLDEALKSCGDKTILLDLKFEDDYEDFVSALMASLVDIEDGKVILQSANLELLTRMKGDYPQYRYLAIIDEESELCRASCFSMIGIRKNLVSYDLVSKLIESGIDVAIWTINSANELKNIIDEVNDYHDDIIYISDHPDMVAYQLSKQKKKDY